MKSKVSRREFLRTAAVAAAGTTLAGAVACQPQTVVVEKEKVVKETVEVEKVVKETVVVEKEKVVKETVVVEKEVMVTPVPTPSQSSEAPMLADRTTAGDLPPVDERIPAEPMVLEPFESIGEYGNSLVQLAPDPTGQDAGFGSSNSANTVATRSYDLRTIIPNVCKAWKLSEDYTEIVFEMRRGMKWSDGAPLTTDDVRFWYEDVLLNEELTPSINSKWTPGDEVMELIVDDDYTFRLRFAVPYPIIIDYLPGSGFWAPKHFLKEFHINYNPDAVELAKSEGFDLWIESYGFHAQTGNLQQDVDNPVLLPWMWESQASNGDRFWVRNPYFWEIDTEGNQLPYADYHERWVTGNLEVLTAKVIAGEGTHASWYLTLPDFPLFKENEAQGDYTAGLYPDSRASEYGLAFNYGHKDLYLRELFNDIRWRMAMSHAMNRDEINELRFAGTGVPRQPIADPGASFYEEGIDQYYVEYDPDKASDLLDEIGLPWDSNEEWRTRADGSPLNLTLEFWAGKSNVAEISELIKGYWGKVGINLTLKPEEKNFYQERLVANETDMGVWAIGGGSEVYSRQNEPIRWRPPWHWMSTPLGGPRWREWLDSDGAEGIEPPEIIKELWDLTVQWLAEPNGTERYMELGRRIFQINAENCWLIGTVGLVPRVAVVANTVHNAPEPGQILSIEYGMWTPSQTEQWWVEG
jgi:peptide/nickel transport system substrate-binding protein